MYLAGNKKKALHSVFQQGTNNSMIASRPLQSHQECSPVVLTPSVCYRINILTFLVIACLLPLCRRVLCVFIYSARTPLPITKKNIFYCQIILLCSPKLLHVRVSFRLTAFCNIPNIIKIQPTWN